MTDPIWQIMLRIDRATATMAENIADPSDSAKQACSDLDAAMDAFRAWLAANGHEPA